MSQVDHANQLKPLADAGEYEAVLYLARNGIGRTWLIATALGWSTPATRRLLIRLERRGWIGRDAERSAVNDICWTLTSGGRDGLLADLRRRVSDCSGCEGRGVRQSAVVRGLRYFPQRSTCTKCAAPRRDLSYLGRGQ